MRRKAAEAAENITKKELAASSQNEGKNEYDELADENFELEEEKSGKVKQTKRRKTTSKHEALSTKRGGGYGIKLSDDEEEEEYVKASGSSTVKETMSLTPTKSKEKVEQERSTLSMKTEKKPGATSLSSILADINKPKKAKKKRKGSGIDKNLQAFIFGQDKSTKIDSSSLRQVARTALANTGKTKVEETAKFAGSVIRISRAVEKSSSDAKEYIQQKAKSTSLVDKLVEQIGTRKKITSLEKSSFDWNKYKEDKGISDELKESALKNSFVEKHEFLQRTDLRRFELEKEQRNRLRAERERKEKTS